MSSSAPVRFVIQFILVMAVQAFVLNDIVIRSSLSLWGVPVFIPIIYPMVLLLLPVNTHSWLGMGLGMAVGLTMDTFSNTPGMHAAACVALMYARPFLLNLFFQQSVKELGETVPTLFRMGFRSFVLYAGMALLLHHFLFYTVQIWSLKSFPYVLLKTLLSGVLSLLLLLIAQLLFARREIIRV
jgi:rod shape-determining protein MreD